MSIELDRAGEFKYRVTVTPPHGNWESDEALTPTDVLERLSNLGCHSTDIADALDETGDDWRPVHDQEVRTRRESGPVSEDERWLFDHGFSVDVEQEEPGLFWAHLVNRDNADGRAPNYGRGATPDQSIKSARRRYEVEELGGSSG